MSQPLPAVMPVFKAVNDTRRVLIGGAGSRGNIAVSTLNPDDLF